MQKNQTIKINRQGNQGANPTTGLSPLTTDCSANFGGGEMSSTKHLWCKIHGENPACSCYEDQIAAQQRETRRQQKIIVLKSELLADGFEDDDQLTAYLEEAYPNLQN